MLKLLIADDELLVLIGLRSMLNWEELGISVCGTAHNGEEALELIEKMQPDIVITDISMPLKNGLEVAKTCREKYGELPLFIILTSYDEFSLAREAVNCQVFEYLVKIDLNVNVLKDTITRAQARVRQLRQKQEKPVFRDLVNQAFRDKFFIRLFHNLFEDENQFELQRKELDLKFSAAAYTVCYCEILSGSSDNLSADKLMNLYENTMQMVRETAARYIPCHVTSLDLRHFNITFCMDGLMASNYCSVLEEVLESTFSNARNYFNVQIVCAVGQKVDHPMAISESYHDARHIFTAAGPDYPVVFFDRIQNRSNEKNVFSMSLLKRDITKAFEELDTSALYETVTYIAGCFRDHPSHQVQAMDAACNLLYLAISLLPEGEKTMSQIFAGSPEGYRSIYRQTETHGIVTWMLTLRDGLCEVMQARRSSYKNRVVANVQEYIRTHIDRKLTLNEVAAVFGFSPNYLSQLFARYSSESFTEYMTRCRIAAAKKMMMGGNAKIYEIAEQLGFENAFYFSKVFKKVEGCSPREYIQKNYSVEGTGV